jgi:hypothetical protein
LLALIVTILVEFVVYFVFIRKKPLKLFLYSALINSFTLPIATYGYQNILNNLLVVETLVFLAEIPLIKLLLEIKYSKSLLLSFVANFATSLIGLIFYF